MLSFVTSGTGVVGTPLHVTAYLNGIQVAPGSLAINQNLPAGVTVTTDATGLVFNATQAGPAFTFAVVGGGSSGVLTLQFTASPLQFTIP